MWGCKTCNTSQCSVWRYSFIVEFRN